MEKNDLWAFGVLLEGHLVTAPSAAGKSEINL